MEQVVILGLLLTDQLVGIAVAVVRPYSKGGVSVGPDLLHSSKTLTGFPLAFADLECLAVAYHSEDWLEPGPTPVD